MSAKTLIAAAVAAALVLPASAAATTKVYGGNSDGGGKVAMDVVVKRGVAKKITELRGDNLPSDCKQSGSARVNVTIPGPLKVSKSGKFSFSYTRPGTNLTTALEGRFKGKRDRKVAGRLTYADHFPATDTQPAENCTTGELGYTAKRGGPDVVLPDSRLRRQLSPRK